VRLAAASVRAGVQRAHGGPRACRRAPAPRPPARARPDGRAAAPRQTPEHLKTPTGEEAFNADGLVQRAIRLLKDTFPDVEVRARPGLQARGRSGAESARRAGAGPFYAACPRLSVPARRAPWARQGGSPAADGLQPPRGLPAALLTARRAPWARRGGWLAADGSSRRVGLSLAFGARPGLAARRARAPAQQARRRGSGPRCGPGGTQPQLGLARTRTRRCTPSLP
jgi:hypothetical protein